MPVKTIKYESQWVERGVNATDRTHSITCPVCGAGFKTRGHARSWNTCRKFRFCPTCGTQLVKERD